MKKIWLITHNLFCFATFTALCTKLVGTYAEPLWVVDTCAQHNWQTAFVRCRVREVFMPNTVNDT